MAELHVVKIKQNRMYRKVKGEGTFEYFPFDRVYLIPQKEVSIVKKLFKYSFIMTVNPQIISVLDYLSITRTRHIGHYRNDAELEWKKPPKDALKFLENSDHIMVVPTYAYQSRNTERHPIRLAYVITAAIHAAHNINVKLPTVILQTPRGQVPLMCSACTEIPAYYANTCTPGRAICRSKINIPTLKLDETFQVTHQKSITEGGSIK